MNKELDDSLAQLKELVEDRKWWKEAAEIHMAQKEIFCRKWRDAEATAGRRLVKHERLQAKCRLLTLVAILEASIIGFLIVWGLQ